MAADGDVASAALVAVTSTREEEKVPAKYLKLNVGGHLFITMASTITEGEHMLSAMFSGRQKVLQDDQGDNWSCELHRACLKPCVDV
eukprot:m.251773 g.251773  ORF g.251773 m.251773 type:complete len:87 (-) comp15461_c0_seq2:3070-3330(-)